MGRRSKKESKPVSPDAFDAVVEYLVLQIDLEIDHLRSNAGDLNLDQHMFLLGMTRSAQILEQEKIKTRKTN